MSEGNRDPLDQRIDRWVSRGRQLVDGVSGARPGSRRAAEPLGPPPGERPGEPPRGRRRLDGLGRWVEDRLDWFLEDGDDWREPWQDEPMAGRRAPAEVPPPSPPSVSPRPRRSLEALSRRGGDRPGPRTVPRTVDPARTSSDSDANSDSDDDWPTEGSFSVPRWQRAESVPSRQAQDPLRLPPPEPPQVEPQPGRPLPRSTRRRLAP